MSLIVRVLCSFAKVLINLVLLPINLVLENSLPGLTDALSQVTSLLNYLIPFAKWVISWLPFGSDFYAFVILCLIFIYTIPLLVEAVKLCVKWWHYLVP